MEGKKKPFNRAPVKGKRRGPTLFLKNCSVLVTKNAAGQKKRKNIAPFYLIHDRDVEREKKKKKNGGRKKKFLSFCS